jgi:hypothetical protein
MYLLVVYPLAHFRKSMWMWLCIYMRMAIYLFDQVSMYYKWPCIHMQNLVMCYVHRALYPCECGHVSMWLCILVHSDQKVLETIRRGRLALVIGGAKSLKLAQGTIRLESTVMARREAGPCECRTNSRATFSGDTQMRVRNNSWLPRNLTRKNAK